MDASKLLTKMQLNNFPFLNLTRLDFFSLECCNETLCPDCFSGTVIGVGGTLQSRALHGAYSKTSYPGSRLQTAPIHPGPQAPWGLGDIYLWMDFHEGWNSIAGVCYLSFLGILTGCRAGGNLGAGIIFITESSTPTPTAQWSKVRIRIYRSV